MDFKEAREGPPFKSKVATHEKYGRGSESIGYGRSGNVRLSRKISLNNQKAECYAIKEYRRGPRETMRAYRNRSTSSFCISSCLRHTNVLNILDLVQEPDFGQAECFRFPWDAKARVTTGRCSSIPYIAPEQYLDGEFDPRPVDVWPMGMIYMAMRTGKLLWGAALKHKDNNYIRYLGDRKLPSDFRPIERLQNVSHKPPSIFLEGSAR
jgi:hypothetical protein